MNRRVVITGIGMVTPLGNDTGTTWCRLNSGDSGTAQISRFDTTGFSTRVGAEVKDFVAAGFIPHSMPKKDLRRYDRHVLYAVSAADEAIEDAGLTGKLAPARTGVYIGSATGGIEWIETNAVRVWEGGPGRVSPFYVPGFIPSMAASYVAMRHNLTGPNLSCTTACATGAHAIGEAYRMVKHGYADLMLAGGTEVGITPLAVAGFAVMGALSKRNSDPAQASRPFDKDRDGFVMGEGAGVVILETLEAALGRQAKVYCELTGYGATCDAYHPFQPDPNGTGMMRSMYEAMSDAGVSAIDYINAHGTSTPVGDAIETKAIHRVFGPHAYDVMVSSTKGATGHMLAAAGAVEAGFCALALLDQVVPPTINYQTADPECKLNLVVNEPKHTKLRHAMSNSFGFGGTNASLVLSVLDADVMDPVIDDSALD